jgi:hypothetical protein
MRSGANANTLRVYNTFTDASNYERGVLDWTTTANTLTIGTQAAGTGTGRQLQIGAAGDITQIRSFSGGSFVCGNFQYAGQQLYAANAPVFTTNAVGGGIGLSVGLPLSWSSTSNPSAGSDVGIVRTAAKVIEFSDGGVNVNGWLQWAGQTRVAADVSANNTTTLATATGLSVALQAGRTYGFDVYLSFTCTAAQGIRAAMVATGGLTATAIEYDGFIVDSAANGIKGNAQSTALGTVVANAALTGTAGVVLIKGTITVNVAGTLNVQFAQSVAAANNTTVKQGSKMIVQDMP